MLRQRLVTGIALSSTMVILTWWLSTPLFALLTLLFLLLAAYEWGSLLLPSRWHSLYPIAALGLAALAWYWGRDPVLLLYMVSAAAVLWLAAMPILLSRVGERRGPGAGWLLFGLPALVVPWLTLIELHDRTPAWVLLVLALVWAADSGAYFAGSHFGRHRLAPQISPGKTWEGVAGALVSVLLLVLLVAPATVGWSQMPALVLVCLLSAIASIFGDLCESLLKRRAGAKDSSRLLPGHGGVLDRIDSLLAAVPVFVAGLFWCGLWGVA